MRQISPVSGLLALFLGGLGALGCNSSAAPAPTGSAAPAASSVASPVVDSIPVPLEEVAKVVNPLGTPAYAGPTGTLRGHIRITGDPPPDVTVALTKGCEGEATATYGKLFRVGQDNAVADVLVTVTGYEGFVPAKEPSAKVQIHGCAFSRRTVSAVFGQRIEVFNLDKVASYMPYLDGQPAKAAMVAVPMGDGVRLYAKQPGIYTLRDMMARPFMTADVFVLKYATHAVTGLDGAYVIEGIPVGKIRVDALLPSANVTAGQEATIASGENTLDLTLTYTNKPGGAPPPK